MGGRLRLSRVALSCQPNNEHLSILRRFVNQFFYLRGRTVGYGHGETVLCHIEGEVLAHNSQTIKTDIRGHSRVMINAKELTIDKRHRIAGVVFLVGVSGKKKRVRQ